MVTMWRHVELRNAEHNEMEAGVDVDTAGLGRPLP